jgi:hypothetical protein
MPPEESDNRDTAVEDRLSDRGGEQSAEDLSRSVWGDMQSALKPEAAPSTRGADPDWLDLDAGNLYV